MLFQKIDSTIVTRMLVPSLFAVLALALGGCSGLRTSPDDEPLVTGGYQGKETTLAVLLPKSGRFAKAAKVVRDGIVAAHKADPQEKRPELRFYDSAAGSIVDLVRQAATDGATLAIGPLQKSTLNKLADATALPIPVLALNQVYTTVKPTNLYQFSLAPENEATTVVGKAWGKEHRKAAILYPKKTWGKRTARAFRRQWKELGGTLIAAQAFDPSAKNFKGTVAKFSEQAAPADFAFLVASAKLARRLWPRLRDEIGAKIPVYSTSHIYSGHFDPKKGDKKLVGLNFVEIPWLIEPTQEGDAVSPDGLRKAMPRLYAMGVDAYRLGARLDEMSDNPRMSIQGKTGILSMDSQRRIQRELTSAHIGADGPRPNWRLPAKGN